MFAHLLVTLVGEDSTQGDIFDKEIAILGCECSDDETEKESMSNSEKEAHIKALFHNSLNNLREELIRAPINHQDLLKPGQPGYNIVFAKLKPIVHKFEWLLPNLSSSDDTNTSARQHARSWQGNNNKKQQKKTSASPQGQQEQQAKVEEFIEKCARWTRPVHQQQQQHQQHHPTRPASTEQHPPQLHHKQQHQLQKQQLRQQLQPANTNINAYRHQPNSQQHKRSQETDFRTLPNRGK